MEWFKPSLRLFFTFVQSVELTLIIAALPDWDEEDLEEGLDEGLVRRSLLSFQRTESGQGAYSFHTLVREFVRGKLETELVGQGDRPLGATRVRLDQA